MDPQLFVIDVKNNKCRPEFLCWQLNQDPIRKKIERIHKGSIQISIRAIELSEVEVAIPEIEKQKKIVELNQQIMKEEELFSEMIENRKNTLAEIAYQLSEKE